VLGVRRFAMTLGRPPRYAIFDLDGVLLDTEPLYTEAVAGVAARFGKVYDWSVKAECIGRGTLEAASIIVTALALPLTPLELIQERDRILVGLFATARAMPGAEAFTRALGRRGVPMAIATSTETRLYDTKAAPHRIWLSRFDAVVCGDDARVDRPKPAPDIFLAAASALGAEPAECVVFEDSPFGMTGALAAGMRVVALPDPAMDRARYVGAHVIAAGFSELALETLGFPPAET
jgi:pseudouridine-5'-monophosphatase